MKAMVSSLVTACTSTTNPSICSSSATPSANFFQHPQPVAHCNMLHLRIQPVIYVV
jgi:hypothetical protein